MGRIVVSGYMIRHPVAGNILAYFHCLLGLHRLGYRVMYVEESGWPYSCYDPSTRSWVDHPSEGLRIIHDLMRRYDMAVPVYYINRESNHVTGGSWSEVKEWLASADLLLNIGGVCWLPEFDLCRRRALIDLDPFFTQVSLFGAKVLHDYHVHFSYGANIGRAGCSIPTNGIEWIATPPPVVPEIWESGGASDDAMFTTIANWSAYGGVEFEGEHYGQKDEEFLRLVELPRRTSEQLEIAIAGGHDVRGRLCDNGWSIIDAEDISLDLPTYMSYITRSKGEFSAAKNAYVKTSSGWFSDRSVCYLAAGLPIVVQDTGFSRWLPTGRGVLVFTDIHEAEQALADIAGNYPAHRRAARDIAREVFDYRVVLPRLLAHSSASTSSPSDIITATAEP